MFAINFYYVYVFLYIIYSTLECVVYSINLIFCLHCFGFIVGGVIFGCSNVIVTAFLLCKPYIYTIIINGKIMIHFIIINIVSCIISYYFLYYFDDISLKRKRSETKLNNKYVELIDKK